MNFKKFYMIYSGSRTKGKIEKIEKLSNVIKEIYYYLNSSMIE